jgi:hypothetical protein
MQTHAIPSHPVGGWSPIVRSGCPGQGPIEFRLLVLATRAGGAELMGTRRFASTPSLVGHQPNTRARPWQARLPPPAHSFQLGRRRGFNLPVRGSRTTRFIFRSRPPARPCGVSEYVCRLDVIQSRAQRRTRQDGTPTAATGRGPRARRAPDAHVPFV